MRIRKLQHLDEKAVWVDDAYLVEDDQGRVEFRYNTLIWGRVGAALDKKIRAEGIALEDVETIIPPDDEVRWLPIEKIKDKPLASVIEALDDACHFPKPCPISRPNLEQAKTKKEVIG